MIGAIIVGILAVGYRLRGDVNNGMPGTQSSRLVYWSIPVGFSTWLMTGDGGAAGGAALAAYAGLMIPHGWAMLGDLRSLWGMGLIMAARAGLVALPVWTFTGMLWWCLAAIAGLSGAAYWAAWRCPCTWYWTHQGTPMGEMLTGFLFGTGMMLSAYFFA